MNDINKIWDEIQKPKNFNKKPSDYFRIDFFTLPHFKVYNLNKFAKNEFIVQALELRDIFCEPNCPKYLFKKFDYSKNLPLGNFSYIVSLEAYINGLWETVKSEKDLNLPS